MNITGTHFNYFLVCHRKLWLFANGIQMEHSSELVEMGKLIHETSYPARPSRFEEVEIGGIKIDFYDSKNRVIHEIKKSDKLEQVYILIENYTTFPLKSIPLIEVKPVALQIQQQHKNDDKHGYKTRDYQTVLPGV